jgi:TonB family protein
MLAMTFSRLCSQQSDSPAPHVHVKVYANETGLKPPQLLPLNLPIPQIDKCINKIDGNVEVSLLVDSAGVPHNIMSVRPAGSDADAFALKITAVDRFTPGTLNGAPVATAVSLKIKIQSCVVEVRHDNDVPEHSAKLRATPAQEIVAPINAPVDAVFAPANFDWKSYVADHPYGHPSEKGILPPVPISEPNAEYTEDARQSHITGACFFSLLVDPQGMPREVKIKKNLDYGLDINAFKAVNGYRFKPAMLDGEPVPMWVNVEVNFRLR